MCEEELEDDEEFEEVEADVRQMCEEHGAVVSLTIPRTGGACVGLVFVEYADTASASTALAALTGKVVSGRAVSVKLYPEDLYKSKTFDSAATVTAPSAVSVPSEAIVSSVAAVAPSSTVLMLAELVRRDFLLCCSGCCRVSIH